MNMEEALTVASADAVTADLGADIAQQLEAGHQVASPEISSEQDFSALSLAAGENSLEAGEILTDNVGEVAAADLPEEETVEDNTTDDEAGADEGEETGEGQ